MDLGRWLRDRKKQAEGVIAQVNPFDNGKTYSTVTRKSTVDPFQSNNVNARYGVLADKGRRDQFIRENQPTSFNAPAATFESLNNLLNKTRDVFDANTQSDITKRVSQGQPANYFDQQRQNNKVPGNSRGTVGQMVYPFVGSVSDFVGSLPGKTLQLAGNALQEPAQYVSKQIRQNPFTHPLGLPGYTYENVKKTVDKINGNQKSTNVFDQTTKLADQSVPEVVKNYGRGLQGYGEQGEDIVSKKINESRFTPQSRQGENRLITNLSSGLGSLGTSIAATVITKNPAAISAAFGLNAAAETTRDARDNGLSASEALDVGTKRGVAEGMLEKFGLERLFNGAKGKLVQTAINSVTTEAPQEFLQSLAGSVAQSQYKPVDWGKAFQQAFTEGAVGGLVGIIGGAAIDIGGFSNSLQENGVEKPNADFIAEEIAKKQAETKVQQQNPILQQTNIPAQPGSIRERIQQAKENVKSTIAETNQLLRQDDAGGYMGGTNAQDRINDPLESLKQEARKYKSAEEFVDSKINSYHQTDAKFDKFENTNQPFRFSGANFFLDTKPPKTIKKYLVEANTNLKNPLVIEDGNITQPMVDKAIKDGYDGIINKLPEGNGFPKRNEIAVFNPETIQTRQQLTDLYNEATKKQGGLRTLMRDEGGGYDGGKSAQDRVNKSKSPLTDKAYSETFGVLLEEAKKDIASINTSKTNPLDSVGMTEQEATRKLESNAPTMSPGNKKTKSLVDSMINDKKLTEAARIAQKEGRELNYFAKKDNNGRSVGIEEYNPSRQRIEAGFVVDNKTGKVLGNHIKVDATGTQINVGGEVVNISDVVGNPLDWKGDYEVSSTMERNIFKNAPNKEIAQKTYKFVVANKIQAEATLRKEIESQRKTLNQNVKDVQKVKPWSVSDKDFKADIFDFIENKKSQADIASKYGPKATQAILKYKNETRKLYDNLLDRANTELAKFGEKTIPKRSDYITHINELNQQPSFAGELMGQLQNSMLGEGYTTTRGGVPGDIAGRTETFSPRKRWNPFAQQRKGGEYTKNPFKAVDSYLEPTLYNIHMTESAVRARAVESAFRTAEILKNTEATKVSTDLDRELEKYKKQSNNAKLVSGFQEYANALAGKTQRWDRQVIDASKGTATALKGWQGLQRIGGRATILGNINSVLMQPLNQASVIAEVKLPNYIKGVASSLAGNNVEDKSPFIRARAAKIESAFRSKGQKVMDKAGIPLQFVELASVKLAWNAEYQQVLSEGLKGQDAIIEADRRTEKAVAGRGIADKPELYRSTLTNGLLQYTLEVNAQNKKFWRDLTPVQKGKFMAAAFGMNTVMEAVTGNKPLPDFLGAAIDTFRDFLDDDDDTPLENAGKGVQRFASEAVSMNPMLSAGANLLPDSTKKTLFGSDSDLTRFEGVPAPIGVIQNAVDVGKNVANGDVKKARDSALKLIPGGNQIRKTLQGKELIQDGGKYDKNGKLQYPAPESPLGKAQALLFGPSATKNAREYYDSMSAKLSGATDKLASLKKDSSGKTIDDFKTIAQSAFNTDKGKEFMALTNDDERKEFARQSSENRGIYDQYKAMQKSFSGGDDLLPSGISKESEKVLNKYDRLVAGTKDKIFEREKGAEYEYNKALYERDLLDGKLNEVDKIRRQKYLAKDKIGAQYEKPIRDTYSLSKAQIKQLVEGSEQGQKIYEQLVKYDQELYDAGLISYRKFKNGLNTGRGGRGRDKKDTSLTDKYALQGQTLSRLQKLLAGTTFAGAETVTTPKTQKAKQKKITVNMKA